MKLKPRQGWMAAALLVTSLWSGTPAFASSIGKEIKIDVGQPEIAKTGYDISADYAVWMVEGENTITLYDLDSNSETKIGNKNSSKTSPRVDGNYVVWIDSRDGGADVYMYDISKQKETRLTDGSAKVTQLEIAGKNVVWDEQSNGASDIYLYNITSGESEQISTSGKASNPSVGDTYVAWQDRRNGNEDIFYYDIKAGQEQEAVTTRGDQVNPSVYGDQIVFEDQSDSYSQISVYTVSKDKTKKLTNGSEDKTSPHLYKDTYVFVDDGHATYGDVAKTTTKDIASFIYEKMPPRVYGDYVLYAKADNDKKLRLNLYDLDDKATVPLGGVAGEPSQPDGHDRYVVYVSEGNKTTSVILYDVENNTSKAITKSGADPIRPLVSNHYVVWYDESEDALFSYDIKKGTTKQVTDEGDGEEPDKKLYEVDGDTLLWVNTKGRPEIMLTDLAKNKSKEVSTLRKDPLSVDIHGDYATWVLEQGSKKASVYLYDIEDDDETEIRKNVQVESAKLGDDFVVWSEYTDTTKPSWDLYYYDIDREKTTSMLRYTDRDQINPQVSRNMVLYEDNRLSPKQKDFIYELYDAEDGSYSDYSFSDKAEVEQPRIGGNRLVWIDTRVKDPYVYTLAFAQPADDDDSDEPTPDPDPEPGSYKEYPILDLMTDGTLSDKMEEAGFDNFVMVFFANTNKEETLSLTQAFEDMDRLVDLFDRADLSEIHIRIYK